MEICVPPPPIYLFFYFNYWAPSMIEKEKNVCICKHTHKGVPENNGDMSLACNLDVAGNLAARCSVLTGVLWSSSKFHHSVLFVWSSCMWVFLGAC